MVDLGAVHMSDLGQSETSALGDRLGLIGIALVEAKLYGLPRLRDVALRGLERAAIEHASWGRDA